MKELTLTELKRIILEILVFIDSFCKKNNIRYSLDGGTLLGAVRHKGFIPWDDDIDIMMPRPDYDRFISIFNDVSNKYKIMCYETDKNVEFVFAKVFDTQTILYEYGADTEIGIQVDVFPIDGFDIRRNIYNYKKLLRLLKGIMAIKKYGRKRKKYDRLSYRLIKICTILFSVMFLGGLCQRLIKKYNLNTSRYAALLAGYNAEKQVFPVSLFHHYTDIEFEGHLFKAVRDYDLYLSNLYGDYMQLPPIEEQIPKHDAHAYIKENIE
jgi:lipopolysaccharide cholinephosphotransferase